jgi:hypothetical protein
VWLLIIAFHLVIIHHTSEVVIGRVSSVGSSAPAIFSYGAKSVPFEHQLSGWHRRFSDYEEAGDESD